MKHKTTGEYRIWQNKGVLIADPSKPYIEIHAAARDVTESRKLEEELRHQGLHDPLTGLPNRALGMDRLTTALARTSRSEDQVGVFFLDIDMFKLINDSLGHAAGDQALIGFGQRVKSALRPGDTIARMGGDEFIVISGSLGSEEDAMRLAKRIKSSLEQPFVLSDKEIALTTSIGIVMGASQDAAEDLVDRADRSMYAAKAGGRADITVNAGQEFVRDTSLFDLGIELRNAIGAGELRLHYQPIVDVRTRKVVSVEALVRWQHSTRGLLRPGDFLPIANQAGLSEQIDRWVIYHAAAQARAWQAHDLFFDVAVNISPSLFLSTQLVEIVMDSLRQTGLDPTRLELEIPESLTSHDPQLVASHIQLLSSMGVTFSVDDFGSGQSFLSYLKRFPINKLKLDRSFVENVSSSAEDALIVRGVIDLAHSLGMVVVAEGVEDVEQLAFLRTHGVDEVQGFLLCEPRPAEDCEPILSMTDPFAPFFDVGPNSLDSMTSDTASGFTLLDTPVADGPPVHILVVDDDASTRTLIVRTLAREGFACIEARSGEEAIQLLNTHRPDAILLDLSMGGMSGQEVLTSIRSDVRRSTVPVLVVSGHNDSEHRIWTLNHGADDFIPKPFDARELAARVGSAIRRGHA